MDPTAARLVSLLPAAGPNSPIAKWITAFGLLIVLVFVAVGLWTHRADWDEMRAARKARRARRRRQP